MNSAILGFFSHLWVFPRNCLAAHEMPPGDACGCSPVFWVSMWSAWRLMVTRQAT